MKESIKHQFEVLAASDSMQTRKMELLAADIIDGGITDAYRKIRKHYEDNFLITQYGTKYNPFHRSIMTTPVELLSKNRIYDAREYLAEDYDTIAFLVADHEAGNDPSTTVDKLNTLKQGLSLIEQSLNFLDEVIEMLPKPGHHAA